MSFNLSNITRGPAMAPPRVVIYGPHGIGKTSFVAEAPSPILLRTEDGTGKLSIPHFPEIARTYTDVKSAIVSLIGEDHEFLSFGLDSLDWLEPLIWRETCARNSWADIETPGYGKGYIAAADVWRELFDLLVQLRDAKGMQVILTAHCEIKQFNDPSNEPYDRYQIKLQNRASAIVQEWADAVLFANYKSYTQQRTDSFKKVFTRGVGLGERVLYTEERPSHYAKNRYDLPPEIAMPKGQSYSNFSAFAFSQPT
jgi:hypothetical protein